MTRRNLLVAFVGLIGLVGTAHAKTKELTSSTLVGTVTNATSTTLGFNTIALTTVPTIQRKQFRCSAGHAWVADDYGACHIQGGGYGTVLEVSDKTIRFGAGERTLCIPCLEQVLMKMGVGEVTSEPLVADAVTGK